MGTFVAIYHRADPKAKAELVSASNDRQVILGTICHMLASDPAQADADSILSQMVQNRAHLLRQIRDELETTR